MCLGCVEDGLIARRTFDAIEAFLRDWPDAEFGPAHIVLSDDNVEDGHIGWCLRLIDSTLSGTVDPSLVGDGDDLLGLYVDTPRDELEATKHFLQSLLDIPESER